MRHEAGFDALKDRILDGPGRTDKALRHAAFTGAGLPTDLESYVTKVREHAYKVTDRDVQELKQTYTEDQIFEITVAAALGAGYRRFDAVRKVMS